ncbi:isopentenyl-diphosphate delta-isomerase [Paenibacillus larvae subsp. larvae]|uniref:Isopentenyl-diphosphate delta-isomerase n=1 Tax=Paenibacillus larvae subsp. larvae TaxID=147375 RepID=A0A2L1U197_9BACL|nr:NUDIX hydrolase [Paenibacillus larvae]AVF26700.1 isopentenyl-diphosphate delta-isomerase [Paenibacillus larvae subsp. larvae]AVF31447.1 isopentenyl-diphosphate delta-isomerase [Paenibacillus larvae subsp. larvae]MDR5605065.1 NUDIX hydrolase [Paenibacillus larvae]
MDLENLSIYDDRGNHLGVASRSKVHSKGYWHETFHCWFISREGGKDYIHFQIRSGQKKDYPNLLDISAAGHILSSESVADGIREVQEELGIKVSFKELIPLGVIKDEIIQGDFIDRELGNVFLYISKEELEERYKFQVEEVTGVIKIEFNSFYDLWIGRNDKIEASGIEVNNHGEKERNRQNR